MTLSVGIGPHEQPPLSIGKVGLPNPFFMAPMAGVTDSFVRVLARRYGCGMVTTEMVSSHLLVGRGAEACLGRMAFLSQERPIAIQIFGADGDILAEAARHVEAAGADIVDLNLGCSVPKVARVGGGAALCRRPATEVGQILEKVVRAVSIPVTVKVRKGWDERHISAFEVLHVAEEAGVAALAIHARTSRQAYGGQADWPFIAELVSRARIPIIGNGDVFTAEDGVRMLRDTGCQGVMIGRASRGCPWIFGQCLHLWQTGQLLAEPTLKERLDIVREHLVALSAKGPNTVVRFRKFVGWYTRGLPNSTHFRDRVCRIADPEEMWRTVSQFVEDVETSVAPHPASPCANTASPSPTATPSASPEKENQGPGRTTDLFRG